MPSDNSKVCIIIIRTTAIFCDFYLLDYIITDNFILFNCLKNLEQNWGLSHWQTLIFKARLSNIVTMALTIINIAKANFFA